MMSQEALVAIITVFCKFSDPIITHYTKISCSEFMVNCSVKTNGVIEDSEVERCKKIYNNQLEKK